jgi:hypothetical protein
MSPRTAAWRGEPRAHSLLDQDIRNGKSAPTMKRNQTVSFDVRFDCANTCEDEFGAPKFPLRNVRMNSFASHMIAHNDCMRRETFKN